MTNFQSMLMESKSSLKPSELREIKLLEETLLHVLQSEEFLSHSQLLIVHKTS